MRSLLFVTAATVFGVCVGDGTSLFSPTLPDINAIASSPVRVAGKCTDKKLQNCQYGFNQYLGIVGTADWVNYQTFVYAINKLLAKNVDQGILPLCQARSLFYQCLGEEYNDCISRFHFLSHGYSQESAWAYVEIFKELEFMCDGGILQSLRNWDCIKAYKQISDDGYTSCYKAYQNTTSYNPAQLCDAAEAMMICAQMPYMVHCGKDVGWWECERARVSLDIDSYCPHLSCSFSPFGDKAVKRSFSRYETFRSENPQFMSHQKMSLFSFLGSKAEERAKRKKRSLE